MNPGANQAAPLDALRAVVRNRTTRTSLRAVATEVGHGINHATIANFLHGAAPQPRVLRALKEWAGRQSGNAPEDVRAMLTALLAGVPENRRANAVRTLMDAIADVYREEGVPAPPWAGC